MKKFISMTLISLLFGCGSKDDTGEVEVDPIDLDQIVTTERPSPRSEVYGIGDPVTNSIVILLLLSFTSNKGF